MRSAAKSDHRVTALELFKNHTTKTDYTITGVVPKGLTFLAGQQKAGKSTLATQIAIAIAVGSLFLDTFRTKHSKVLFLSIEEAPDLVGERIQRLCTEPDQLQNIEYRFKFESLDEGGLEKLEWLIEESPDIGLVIIDTLANFIGDSTKGKQGYLNESRIARIFHKITKHYGVAIIAIHHTVKKVTGTINDLRGFGGYAGTADNILMLTSEKSRGIGRLQRIGRYGDADYALKYNQEKNCWGYLGCDFEDTILSPERQDILEILMDAYGPLQAKQIAKEVRKSPSATSNLLKKLLKQKFVRQQGYGIYQLTESGRRVIANQL